MKLVKVLLADLAAGEQQLTGQMSSAMREGLILFGAVGFITLGLLLWVLFVRKPGRRRRSRRHSSPRSSSPGPQAARAVEDSGRRRRRRRHRPRNPTLAETRGLPPLRPETPTETFS